MITKSFVDIRIAGFAPMEWGIFICVSFRKELDSNTVKESSRHFTAMTEPIFGVFNVVKQSMISTDQRSSSVLLGGNSIHQGLMPFNALPVQKQIPKSIHHAPNHLIDKESPELLCTLRQSNLFRLHLLVQTRRTKKTIDKFSRPDSVLHLSLECTWRCRFKHRDMTIRACSVIFELRKLCLEALDAKAVATREFDRIFEVTAYSVIAVA